MRNNITTADCPLGLFHPHAEYHHIKKENIGLIEVMGLAVLPARLKKEMAELEQAILNHEDLRQNETMAAHADWQRNGCQNTRLQTATFILLYRKKLELYLRKFLRMQEFIREQRKGKLHSKDLLKVYKKGPLHFCEMVLRKNVQFSQIVLLVFIHGMDAQNIQRRILKGCSDIF